MIGFILDWNLSNTASATVNYSCTLCPYSTGNAQLLKSHLSSHAAQREFSCDVCFKTFTYKCNLTAHMRLHTGEKPYSCKFCNKTFMFHSSYKSHLYSSHKDSFNINFY